MFRPYRWHDSHDGGQDVGVVWREKDYNRAILGIKEEVKRPTLTPDLPEIIEEIEARGFEVEPYNGPTGEEINQALQDLRALSSQIEQSQAQQAYLAHVSQLLELFAIREQQLLAEELILILMM